MKPSLRDLIPPLIVLVFLGSAVALVGELLIAAAAGRSADGAATTALGAILTACVPALVALYLRDTGSPPKQPDPEEEPQIGEESLERAHDFIKDYLDKIMKWRPEWMPRST